MNFFKKTPEERYQAAFEKTYALETRGATLCVSCNAHEMRNEPRGSKR